MKYCAIGLFLMSMVTATSVAGPVFEYVTPVTAYVGSKVTLTAVFSPPPPPAGTTFQWQKSTTNGYVNLADNANISGTTTTNLTIQASGFGDAGDYRVFGTNSSGSGVTSPGRLTILSLLSDVTSPGDAIAEFGNTGFGLPGNAIDNTWSNYFNSGHGQNAGAGFPPFVGPAGLIITPAAGPTRVSGIRLYTSDGPIANDPADYQLDGSNDGGVTFSPVASGAVSLDMNRNLSEEPLDPLTSPLQEILFFNPRVFTTYRVTFNHVKDDNSAAGLQIGELELLGITGPPNPTLVVTRNLNGTLNISTSGPGLLQSCTNLAANPQTWVDEVPINGSTTISPAGQNKFYRVKSQ